MPDAAFDAPIAPLADEAVRVAEHWSEQVLRARADNSYWLNNRIIVDRTYRLIAGKVDHWVPWLMADYFHDIARFEHVLSVCCGDAVDELAMFRSGKIGVLHGFDISAGALNRAAANFRAAGVPEERFQFEVADANALELRSGPFDLIVSCGAIHHVANLEGMLATLAGSLKPEGRLVLLEFVGPNRMQWTDTQVNLINRLLGALDVEYLRDRTRIEFSRPPVEALIAIDPSEAIRSGEILGLVPHWFDVEYRRDFHGTILHMLYPLLNPELTNQGRKDFDSIVRLIAEFESILITQGVIQSDFVFMVCRPKPAT